MVSRPQRLHKNGRISNSSKIYKMFLFSILLVTAILVPSASSEAYCPDGQLEKSIIDSILDLINDKRSTLAKGKLDDGSSPAAVKFPKAKAMNKLEWGCNLEEKAIQKLGLDCAISTAPAVNNKAVLFYADDDKFGLPPSFAVANWLKEHRAAAFTGLSAGATDVKRPATGFDNFANLMNEKTTKIGCAELICKNGKKRPLLCLTNKPLIAKDEVIYTVDATKACSGCNKNTRPCNKETKLCEAPEQSTTESTTPSASEPNTICPNNDGMNDALRNASLELHNQKRAELASGTTAMGSASTNMRQANNMPELVIDCDLEKAALEEAQKCEEDDDKIGREFNKMMVPDAIDLAEAQKTALEEWWNEINSGPVIDQIQNLYYDHSLKQHFSKMATDKTKKVGCAAVKCDKGVRVVCRYEGILKNGEKIYNMGPTCKKCSAGAGMADCQAEPYPEIMPRKIFVTLLFIIFWNATVVQSILFMTSMAVVVPPPMMVAIPPPMPPPVILVRRRIVCCYGTFMG
ncbi:unnamed protein product [Cylicocyclus nassatus]|uniref:SCP domain-containing protein n=1 Tax=Cylicocyclus nassatus TaxID=53992 RepID=A0AA36H168_CYLNA|nr:unnamed protein product [Cylicocyclus nassatus]